LSFSSSGGISEADQWRLTANFNVTAPSSTDFTSNWERNDSNGFGYIGTGMTESSGIFTFPTTGYYLIEFTWTGEATGLNRYFGGYITCTINNSTYIKVAEGYELASEASANGSNTVSHIFDVTSTANCKVKFGMRSDMTNANAQGSSTLNYTHATFIKLGDT
jgi:hypothetical protein